MFVYPVIVSCSPQKNQVLITNITFASMKFLVYGHTGWIGKQLLALFRKQRGLVLFHATARLEDVHAVEKELDTVRPDQVILCAGVTGRPNVDWCESHKEETAAVNFYGTVGLVKACHARRIHVTNFATGCIFEYDARHALGSGIGFTEEDDANFFGSFYSQTKAAAEAATRDCANQLLFRVRMPITADNSPRCFITKISNYAKVVDIPNSVTVLPDLLPLAVEMIIAGDTGVYNFVNPGPISHGTILNMYKEIIDPAFSYTVMDMAEHDTRVVAKRSNNELSSKKLEARFPGRRIPTAEDSVRALFQKRAVYIPKVLLVTGGAGFIGSAFVRLVSATVKKIVVIDSLQESASLSNLDGVNNVHFIKADILDGAAVLAALADFDVDAVVHFAAQTHVDASFTNSLLFTKTNVLGTHQLLQCALQYGGVKRFLHISTDEVYGETLPSEATGMQEDRILLPTNPYAASKVGAEALVHAYQKSYNLPTVILRANNAYGPRQFPEKVVPRFLLRHELGLPLQIQGSGDQSRHFLYVDDAARGVLAVLTRGAIGEVYNVASRDEFTILQLANVIQGSDAETITVDDRKFNDQRYWVDDQKLRKLGWAAQVSFAEGLAATKAWYQAALPDLDTIWPRARDALFALDTK